MVAILDRELRIRARQRRTFLHRFLIASASSLATVLGLFFASLSARAASIGHDVFIFICWALFFLCLCEGFRSAADSLSEEKRDGTLGLLFLTDLSSAEIILGKTSGHLIDSLYALFAAVPALGIPIILGGVTAAEFWRAVLALFLTLGLSLSLGILASAWVFEVLDAWVGTFLLLGGAVALAPLLSSGTPSGPVPSTLSIWSPFTAIKLLQSDVYDPHPLLYWRSMAYCAGVILVALTLACWLLPRRWQAQALAKKRPSGQPGFAVRSVPPGLRNVRPIEWFVMSQRTGRLDLRLPSALLALGLVGWAIWTKPDDITSQYFIIAVSAFLYHTVLSVNQTLRATTVGASLRNSGLLELVFITPLRPQEIVQGLGRGLVRQAVGETGIFVLGELLCIAVLIERAAWMKVLPLGSVLALSACTVIALWPPVQDLWAGTWLGLYQGIRQTKTRRAVTVTIAWVQGLELLLYQVCLPLGPVLSLVKSLIIFLWSRDRLLFEFPRIVRADTVSVGKGRH